MLTPLGLFPTNVPINSSGRLFHPKSGHKADWFYFRFEENRITSLAGMRFELRALGAREPRGAEQTLVGRLLGTSSPPQPAEASSTL